MIVTVVDLVLLLQFTFLLGNCGCICMPYVVTHLLLLLLVVLLPRGIIGVGMIGATVVVVIIVGIIVGIVDGLAVTVDIVVVGGIVIVVAKGV